MDGLLVKRLDVCGMERVLIDPHIIHPASVVAAGLLRVVADTHGRDKLLGQVRHLMARALQTGGIAQKEFGAVRADGQGDQAPFAVRGSERRGWLP